MNLDSNFLFASLLWGSVGSGYSIYGWKQRKPVPLAGGVAMMGISYLVNSASLMSLLCLAVAVGIYWVPRRA